MQRLFSTFPSSWPGVGLLLLRLGVGIALIYLGISPFFGPGGAPVTLGWGSIEPVGGIFLIAGLWTPIVGAIIAIAESGIAFSLNSSQPDSRLIHIFLAVLGAGVAMLGPGAWSIDARLFGRKRFTAGERTRGRKPSL